MSEDSSPQKNLLRHFRFQKKPVNKLGSSDSENDLNGSTSSDVVSTAKRGGQVPIVESGDENSPAKVSSTPDNLAMGGLRGLAKMFPIVRSQVIEKYLISCQGDFLKAKQLIEREVCNIGNDGKPKKPNTGNTGAKIVKYGQNHVSYNHGSGSQVNSNQASGNQVNASKVICLDNYGNQVGSTQATGNQVSSNQATVNQVMSNPGSGNQESQASGNQVICIDNDGREVSSNSHRAKYKVVSNEGGVAVDSGFVDDSANATLHPVEPTDEERPKFKTIYDLNSSRVLTLAATDDVPKLGSNCITVVSRNEGASSEVNNPGVQTVDSYRANFNKQRVHSDESVNTGKRRMSPDSRTNGKSKVKRFKKIRAPNDSDDFSGSDSDTGKYRKEKGRVFDSDEDSESEITNHATKEQKEVLEFLSEATLSELLCVPNISKKKADLMMELRPFEGWRDMVEKFQESKGLSCDIFNLAQEFLYTRQVVTQLMHKCSKLSQDLERFNNCGLSVISSKPSLLSPELTLAGYQMVGLNWLAMLHQKGLNGILADEMGLGKTVQIISFLAWLKAQNDQEDEQTPNLIVVPSSTLNNWKNELDRWCPALTVLVYYGDKEERRSMRANTLARGGVKDYDIVLTTYNMLTTTPEEKKMFKVLRFGYVIFDEAHMLKNMKTTRYEQLSQVNASRRFLLTGTPLQNSLLELMSLLTFVMPEMFKNKKEYLKCLFTKTKEGKGDTPPEESNPEVLPRFEQEQVAQAKKIMKPFVLRRLKKDVLRDLPKKTEILQKCDMLPRQRDMYDNLIKIFSKRTDLETEKVDEADEISHMGMMMQLRKVANHPLMVRELYTNSQLPTLANILVREPDYKEKNLKYCIEDLGILSDFELHCLCQTFPKLNGYTLDDEVIVKSGKFTMLDKLLPELREGNHRLLIFSQFVTMLNILAAYMNIRGYKFLRLDGQTPVNIRQEMIDEFNKDPSISVFLLSTRAGGLGINLTAADTVVVHDLDFNPYNDKQAEDRCHRVGQTNPVTVYRLVSTNSIEEDIYQIACEKLHLEKEISAEDKEEKEEVKDTKHLLKKALAQGTSPQKNSSS